MQELTWLSWLIFVSALCCTKLVNANDEERATLLTIPFMGADVYKSVSASRSSDGAKHEEDIDAPLENIDIAYLINLSIGSPPQPFTLLLDTGSSTSWVPSFGCGRFCGYPLHTLRPSNSTTFNSTNLGFTVTYGQGYSHGLFAQDTFTLNGLTVSDVYFGLSYTNDGELTEAGADGILGLGPDELSKFNNPEGKVLPTLVTTMVEQGYITKNVFSIFFRPMDANAAPWDSVINGEITFGGVNKSNVDGPVNYTPLTKEPDLENYWAVDIDDILIGDQSVELAKKLTALVDTGSTLIYLPPNVIRKIFHQVEGFRRVNGLYIVPCDSTQLRSVTFMIGGNEHMLMPKDYLIRRGKLASFIGNTCSTYFMDSPPGFGAILGYGFLQQFITVFDSDNKRVGFGQRLVT